ncbi:AbrB/MazE/SpoVT family DNA-binding domain-containing protein [Fodinicurvata halophila]|uniref:AbrB/MazE/SpoVT family DNA-binding domain-containing protein n=1 Tax=Fodinicurvata halophila TaxID=1419723 RepID=A0ABV8UQ82_9PROT
MQTQIKRWGNSAAIRLSSRLLAKSGLEVSSEVNIEVKDNKIIIEPLKQADRKLRLPFSEEELLDGMTPDSAHADEVARPIPSETAD